jgi:hypothetical protein
MVFPRSPSAPIPEIPEAIPITQDPMSPPIAKHQENIDGHDDDLPPAL